MTQTKALDNRQVIEKAVIVLFGFLASGVLGFIRTGVLAGQFGTGAAFDTFVAAQRIPEIIFTLVAGGALGSSFIPIYAKYREHDPDHAWQLASAVMTLASLAAAVLGLIVAIFAPQLVRIVLLPGRSIEEQQLTVDMVRLMMVTPFIFSISGLVMGILQSHSLFFLPALAISMNNIGIIIGALIIAPLLPAHPTVGQVAESNVMGLAYGAVLSAILHLAVQIPGLRKIRARLRPLFAWQLQGVRDVLRLMGPRVLGLAVVQVNFVVNINLASNMVDGSLAALQVAFTLMFFALGIIGQSVGSAVFPTLSALWSEGDYDGFKDRLSGAMRNVLYLSFPATAVFILLGEPIVSLFERGEWNAESTQAAAWALGFYATGIAGFTLLEVLSRAFYALEDTWTPVMIGIGAMVSNIILNLIFIQIVGVSGDLARGPFAGLALANASTTVVESLVLWWLMRRRVGKLGDVAGINDGAIIKSATGTILSTVLMGVGLWLVTQVMVSGGWTVAVVGGGVGAVIFFGVGYGFNLGETRELLYPLVNRGLRLLDDKGASAMTKQLDGKVVVITGAGRGIGRGIAVGFASEGARIVCAARTQAQLDETVATIKAAGGDAIAVQTDVTSAESVQHLYDETMLLYGKLDVVIANAGGNFSRASVEDSDIDDWLFTLEVNLMGVYYTLKYAIPYMKADGGHMILMGSGLGHRVGDATHSAYSASKAGAWMLVRSLAKELRAHKICVNELIPGVVQTDILPDDPRPDDSPLNVEWVKSPADVVPLALFIATQPLLGPTGQSFSLMRRDSQ